MYCIFIRYKDLVADSVDSPLLFLANNLRMPAMLVAKYVLAEVKTLKHRHDNQKSFNDDILNDSYDVFNDNCSYDDSSLLLAPISTYNNLLDSDLDSPSSIDTDLSNQLNWLSSKLLLMHKVLPPKVLDQSANSSTESRSYHGSTSAKSVSLSPHQLATSTWMISSDPQMAYEVFKCSVMDGYYGACVEFIKRYLFSYQFFIIL